MTDEELVWIHAAATAAGLSVPSYLVAVAMRQPGESSGLSVADRRSLAGEILGIARVLRRAAENLNRLTAIAQREDRLSDEVPATAEALRGYVARFDTLVSRLDPRRAGRAEAAE